MGEKRERRWMATKKETAAPADGGKKKSGKKWIILILLLLILGGAGGGWYWWTHIHHADDSASEDGKAVKKKKKKKDQAPVFVSLDAFTVNLQGEDNQLLQISIALQVADEEDAVKLKQHVPLIRSRLVLLLSSKQATEILTVEGKAKLAKDVAEQIKQPFSPGDSPMEIQDVLFTSFIVQ